MAGRRVTIRPATPSDIEAAAELLRLRDGRDYARADVDCYLAGFDPERALGWLAFDDARPVGLSMIYLRTVAAGAARYRVGYWGNLFVDPDYRRAMVYPRLPLAMFRGAQERGLDFVLTATRRQESSGVHLQLGCRELGELRVLMKPLRPVRLLAQRRGWPWARGLAAALPDAAFGGLLRLYTLPERLRGGVEEIDWSSAAVEEVVELRRAAVEQTVHRAFGAGELRDRFRGSLEGEPYVLLGARRRGALAAAAIYRLGERGGTRAGVIMEVCARAGEEAAASSVLAHAEARARRDGADVMLYLDGVAGPVARRVRRLGYVRSPEVYRVLVWPKALADPSLLDVTRWSFSFADHDAF